MERGKLAGILPVFNDARAATPGLSAATASLQDLADQTAGETILVATRDGSVVGFVAVWPEGRFVHHLYVAPDCQGEGIGTALVTACRERWGLPLRLKCVKDNRRACAWYRHRGWVDEGEGTGPDGRYVSFRLGDDDRDG